MFMSYPQSFFPLVSEALFALSFSFLSVRSFHPCSLAHSRNDNAGVTGQFLPPKTDFEHTRT